MILTENEKKYVKSLYVEDSIQINLRHKSYYIKPNYDDCFLKEKLGERLFELVGVKHALYDEITIDESSIIISDDLNNYGNFTDMNEFFENGYYLSDREKEAIRSHVSLTEIWASLEKSINDVSFIMRDVIKMYIIDILFLNLDRNNFNWGILTQDDNLSVCVLDNSEFLNFFNIPIIHSYLNDEEYDINFYNLGIYNIIDNDAYVYLKTVIMDLENFLKVSSSEFLDIFDEILSIITSEVIDREIFEIEQKYNREMPDKENVVVIKCLLNYFNDRVADLKSVQKKRLNSNIL